MNDKLRIASISDTLMNVCEHNANHYISFVMMQELTSLPELHSYILNIS